MKFENLMREELAAADNLEVVMSLVEIPPNTRPPAHTHPGEEFAYLIEGSLVLWREGHDEVVFSAGQSGKVPINEVHTTFTREHAAKILVFRVHQKGQPERVLVETS